MIRMMIDRFLDALCKYDRIHHIDDMLSREKIERESGENNFKFLRQLDKFDR